MYIYTHTHTHYIYIFILSYCLSFCVCVSSSPFFKYTQDKNYVNVIFMLYQFCRSLIMSFWKNYLILLKFGFFNIKSMQY